jgi:hypothetical protein
MQDRDVTFFFDVELYNQENICKRRNIYEQGSSKAERKVEQL